MKLIDGDLGYRLALLRWENGGCIMKKAIIIETIVGKSPEIVDVAINAISQGGTYLTKSFLLNRCLVHESLYDYRCFLYSCFSKSPSSRARGIL